MANTRFPLSSADLLRSEAGTKARKLQAQSLDWTPRIRACVSIVSFPNGVNGIAALPWSGGKVKRPVPASWHGFVGSFSRGGGDVNRAEARDEGDTLAHNLSNENEAGGVYRKWEERMPPRSPVPEGPNRHGRACLARPRLGKGVPLECNVVVVISGDGILVQEFFNSFSGMPVQAMSVRQPAETQVGVKVATHVIWQRLTGSGFLKVLERDKRKCTRSARTPSISRRPHENVFA
ncbi:hypothetical protein BJ322DRAFT_1023747 [Thelephora terrestris]|uniref:Uncharacterized protein n=1 Tax=Thelephora terrestris TaxID=56493 RepID=A0A9P6H808_9AGAM|nr:hypothetical protein BJ322DRAFT_1023747 [Thelephora terrestris]